MEVDEFRQFENRRVLVIDDEPSIHADFRSILEGYPDDEGMAELESALFGTPPGAPALRFSVVSAHQGNQCVPIVQEALAGGLPFSVAFVDMRMPPGWDGMRTIEELWKLDSRMQVVICTAYSDHAWEDMLGKLAAQDHLLVVKKPFDPVEVLQAARTLSTHWSRERMAEALLAQLRELVSSCKAKANDGGVPGLPSQP